MNNKILIKPISFKPTSDIDKALKTLQSMGFDRSKFIRLAIEEKLYRDYRSIIKQLKPSRKDIPDFVK